jgi:hypothetical protein
MLKKHNKPYFIFNLQVNPNIEDVTNWIISNKISTLNVAGPRESQSPGIYKNAFHLLELVYSSLIFGNNNL